MRTEPVVVPGSRRRCWIPRLRAPATKTQARWFCNFSTRDREFAQVGWGEFAHCLPPRQAPPRQRVKSLSSIID